jgi:hypothetical protein
MLCLFNQRIKIETTEVIGLEARSPYWRQEISTKGGNKRNRYTDGISFVCGYSIPYRGKKLLSSVNVSRHSPNLIYF